MHLRRPGRCACGLTLNAAGGRCHHCDQPCRTHACRLCKTLADHPGTGPASTGPVPGRWPDGGPLWPNRKPPR